MSHVRITKRQNHHLVFGLDRHAINRTGPVKGVGLSFSVCPDRTIRRKIIRGQSMRELVELTRGTSSGRTKSDTVILSLRFKLKKAKVFGLGLGDNFDKGLRLGLILNAQSMSLAE